MLGSHVLFTWGDTAYDCYVNTLTVVEKCAQYIEDKVERNGSVFGGQRIQSLNEEDRKAQIGRAQSELQSLMRSSYAVFCLKKKNSISCKYNTPVPVLRITKLVGRDSCQTQDTTSGITARLRLEHKFYGSV